ncbi:hypothetical protein ANCDUO_16990 [Ancylostoma duodenale]|uniref:Small integral membrane protein 14 n=1 Tax=Ancylostoma duodenale TaxID=51022 RepID=A0A0C2G1Y5_9BILA|nr:hypothetical protein ANCDUO_16990 [Ancylostoma duodenale]
MSCTPGHVTVVIKKEYCLDEQLRDTQDYCTDSECLTDGGPTAIATNSILLWTMLWGFLALVLFFLRPNSMRSNPQGLGKPGPSNDRRVSVWIN